MSPMQEKSTQPVVNLLPAQEALVAGLKVVELSEYSKQPKGKAWNKRSAAEINPNATGYGLLLRQNNRCSIDPDHEEYSRIGLAALGFDLDEVMSAGVRTLSTRPNSGGRSMFTATDGLRWIKFAHTNGDRETTTALELRAYASNLQDSIPGLLYRAKDGTLCTQTYANGKTYCSDVVLSDQFQAWWERLSTDIDFYRDQNKKFWAAVSEATGIDYEAAECFKDNAGTGHLPYTDAIKAFDPGLYAKFNGEGAVVMEALFEYLGFQYIEEEGGWTHAGSSAGRAGIWKVPGTDSLFSNFHAGLALPQEFDALTCFIAQVYNGNLEEALPAAQLLAKKASAQCDFGDGDFEEIMASAILAYDKNAIVRELSSLEVVPPKAGYMGARILEALAARLKLDPADVAARISYNPTAADEIFAVSAWHPDKGKMFVMRNGLKLFVPADFTEFWWSRLTPLYDGAKLTKLAEDYFVGQDGELTAAQLDKAVASITGLASALVIRELKIEKQFSALELRVDPFVQNDCLELSRGVATLVFKQAGFKSGTIDEAVIADYKQHFPEFDTFMELLVASRFANTRKQAHLWMQASSNWGKSFLLGCLAHHGLVVETSVPELDKIMSGGPVGKTLNDFLNSWVLAVDEFKGVTKEVKQLSTEMAFAPKGLPTVSVPLYLKLFLSAEDVPSLTSDGVVEDQFANRFTHFVGNGELTGRTLFLENIGAYKEALVNYIGAYLNDALARYVPLGRLGAGHLGDTVISAFYEKYKISKGAVLLSDQLPDLAAQFAEWSRSTYLIAVGLQGLKGGLASATHRLLVEAIEVDRKTGHAFCRMAHKVFQAWLDQEFSKQAGGTLLYKKDRIFEILGAIASRRVNKAVCKCLPLGAEVVVEPSEFEDDL